MDKADAQILLVEDEPALQYVFRRQLERLGYRVGDVANDGVTAVEKILASQYHLVFMDVRLPVLDGISATRRVREAEVGNGRHTTILGMTAFADQRRCLEAGMDDFLQKPVLLEEMDALLTKWLSIRVLKASQAQAASAEKFARTDEKLRSIQEKLAVLRAQSGLSR